MASRTAQGSAPLTFDLPLPLIEKIEACRKGLGLKTASEVVRQAVESLDFAKVKFERESHRQISVRLTADQRLLLKRQARIKNASVGELIRVALENITPKAAAKPAKKKR